MQIANFLRRPGRDKGLKHILNMSVTNAGSQLAIRECTRTTFTKLHIRTLIQCPRLPEALYGRLTAVHITAAFQDQRIPARFSQRQCRKHACRAKTDHHRTQIMICMRTEI